MLIFDLETDNLLDECTVIHCAWTYDTISEKFKGYRPDEVGNLWKDLAADQDGIVAHNGLDFDLEVLKKFYGHEPGFMDFYNKAHDEIGTWFVDTLILGRLLFPDIGPMDWAMYNSGSLTNFPDTPVARKKLFGNHNLKAWGYRLGTLKGEFDAEDFSTFTEEMYEYNKQDVVVTNALFSMFLGKISKLDNTMCIELEHRFALYLFHQMKAGVCFDVDKAEFLVECWRKMLSKDIIKMRAQVSDIIVEEEFIPKRDNKTLGYIKDKPIIKRKVVPFNPKSGDHIIFLFMEKYGWEPTEFTGKKSDKWPNGKPSTTHEVLNSLPFPEAKLLSRIKLLMDRIALVESSQGSWIKTLEKDGRIHGRIIHNGTPTSRCRHSKPNLGNIPSPKATWGKTLRGLFKAAPGHGLVGTDADGLEMRLLAHGLYPYDNGQFFDTAFNGRKEDGTDAHTLNMHAINQVLKSYGIVVNRECAKTVFYAILYGAFPKRVALTIMKHTGIHLPAKKQFLYGSLVLNAIKENILGLNDLLADLERSYNEAKESGKVIPHLYMPDGRPVPIRSLHSILNTFLQTLGADVIKLACVMFWDYMEEAGLKIREDWQPVLHVHDEFQVEVKLDAKPKCGGCPIEVTRRLASRAIADAGKEFGLNVPLLGHSSSGRDWSETH